jgi:hypothetical protein
MFHAKPVEEIIKERFSCRSYLKVPIAAETRVLLADFAASLRSGPLGSQSRFELVAATGDDLKALKGLGTYGFIKGATGFFIGATKESEKYLEDYGYLMEKIILYATTLGLGTCWLGGTFTKSSFAKKISADQGEIIPAVTSVGYIAKKPRRLDALIRRGAKADKRLPWEELFFDGEFGVPLSEEAADDYARPLEMVRIGPSASNRQPWRILKDGNTWHFYLQRSPGYRERRTVKLFTNSDLQRVDMGIAMCHFELTARELGLEGRWEMNPPRIIVNNSLAEFMASWVTGNG